MEVDARRVGRCDGVGDEAEGDNHGAEITEGMEGAETLDDERTLAIAIGGCVFGVCGYARCEANPAEEGEGEGCEETKKREREDLDSACPLRVVDKEIGC